MQIVYNISLIPSLIYKCLQKTRVEKSKRRLIALEIHFPKSSKFTR